MKLPIYCVAYNLGWLIASIVALPLFGKLVMVLNPVYLVALQYQRTFERILNSLERVIALHSQLGGIVFLMFYVLAVSTFLWAVLGFIVGAGMDISGWTPGKRASSAENA